MVRFHPLKPSLSSFLKDYIMNMKGMRLLILFSPKMVQL